MAAALLACLLVVLLGTAAQAATPTPAPAPTSGSFAPSTWACSGQQVPQAVPSPGTDTSTSCAVTSWATVSPEPVASGGASPVCVTASPCVVQATDDQYGYVAFAFGLLVLLLAAGVVGSWGR